MQDPATEIVQVETDAQGWRTLVIHEPGRSLNVLSPALRAALIAAVDAALADPGVRGIILTARGRAFIAGADLTVLGGMRGRPAEEVRAFTGPFRAMLRRMEQGGKPVVAAINGTALGGGFELCLACHHRIVADAPGLLIGLPESALGLLPGAGGTQRLGRLIGVARALPLVLEGRRLTPAQALEAGLVDAVVAPEALLPAARAWLEGAPAAAQPWDRADFAVPGGVPGTGDNRALLDRARAAADPNDPAPLAIVACFSDGLAEPMDAGLEIEGQRFAELARGPVAQNRIRAFFSMGAARKAAVRPDAAPFKPTRLGVLGAGLMGRGVAEVAALRGLDVVLVDRDAAAARAGRAAVGAALDRSVARGRLGRDAAVAALARITAAQDLADLSGCGAVIEAVPEDRALKAEVTRAALAVTGADVLFASNTSKLPITGLADASPAPERFVGMHFFSPVPRMALVEVILGAQTGARAHAEALDLARLLGKTPVVVRDGRGFFTSRVVSTYLAEGLGMLVEGVAPAAIEAAGCAAGMPMGPLATADAIDLGTMLQIREQERIDLGAAWRAGPDHDALARMVALGRTGKRAGAGFHVYTDGAAPGLWDGLADVFARSGHQPAPETLRQRLLVVQSVEAARAWADGIVEAPRMADVASLLGWAFPAWTGGVMSLIDQGGLGDFIATADALRADHGPRFDPPQRLRDLARSGGTLYP
ncbi:MAG: 3-hydroxyacyl-CoA dehydrogenase NAD-binding domain-containing protein [Alkalilacustris sp.]